jgi:hypothetical protein
MQHYVNYTVYIQLCQYVFAWCVQRNIDNAPISAADNAAYPRDNRRTDHDDHQPGRGESCSPAFLLRLKDTHVRVVNGGPDPAASAAFFRGRPAGYRIPEFFSRSVVSLVIAKGEPSEVE